jgi:zinc/manganese transport system substrate-binding protein
MYKKIMSLCCLFLSAVAFAKPIAIVAAENFYGDVAKQIGGPYVKVTNIMNNPNQDPHLFSSSPATAKAIAAADMVIYNGIDYDPWMDTLLSPNANQERQMIVVANLLGKKSGDNPHLWYEPNTMLVYANHLTERLGVLDAKNKNYFQQQLSNFKQQHNTLLKKIATLKQQYQGTSVIATEPVFNYMADALGLNMQGKDFQISVMNEVAPSAKDTQDFEDKLNKRLVKILIYNGQVTNPLTDRVKSLAKKSSIPIIGVSETQPLNQTYFGWMNDELDALAIALSHKGSDSIARD